VELATLLATEDGDGHRRVVRDPVALTPRLRSLAERSGAAPRGDLERAEQALFEIAQRRERDGVEAVTRDLDTLKAGLGVSILASPVLRAVVFCDATVWRHDLEDQGGRRTPRPGTTTARSGESNPSAIRWATSLPMASVAGSSPRPEPSGPRPVRRTRTIARLVGVAMLLGLAAHAFWSRPREDVHVFSVQELAALSPQIASGYRSGSGSGPLFVGTVKEGWAKRPYDERGEAARHMIDRLARSGVREVLLLDEARRIAVHHADGIPLRIGPEPKATG